MITAFRPNALCFAFVTVIAHASAQDRDATVSHRLRGIENIEDPGRHVLESKLPKEFNNTLPSQTNDERSLGEAYGHGYYGNIFHQHGHGHYGPSQHFYHDHKHPHSSGYSEHTFVGTGDLGIRFNKVSDPDSGPFFQLQATDYPIRGETAQLLKTRSIGDAIVIEDDYELYGRNSAVDYIRRIGAAPTMPNSDPRHPFWADFRYVVDVQLARRANADPNEIFRLPDLWLGMNIHEVAEAVRKDYPGSLQQELIEFLFKDGIELDYDMIPFRSKRDIIAKQFRFADLNTWVYSAVAPTTFLLKWHVGLPRPEEVAWKIATGELTTAHGVPEDIVYKINSMNLRSSPEFTAYSEGCPAHPAWPAMHASGSTSSLWLSVICKDLTPEQYCEALRLDYAIAFARTVAGVHYGSDNIAGLNLGQEVMKEKLAGHFAKYYGSDRSRVQAKIERWSVDWAEFNPNDCTFGRYAYSN